MRWRRVLSALLGSLVLSSAVACADGTSDAGPGPLALFAGAAANSPISIQGCSPQRPLVPGDTSDVCGGNVVDTFTSALVRYDRRGRPYNDLAHSITSSDDRHFTIRIREDATFHDGTPVTADSFVRAWNDTAYGPNGRLNANYFANVTGFADVHPGDGSAPRATTMSGLKVVDDHTFTVTLTSPMADLRTWLGYRAYAPLPDVYFTDRAAYERAPVGTGAFRVTQADDTGVSLARFHHYVGPSPANLDELRIDYYGEPQGAYLDLRAGQLDVSHNLPTTTVVTGKARDDFPGRITSARTSAATTLRFATHDGDPTVQDPRLRKALSLAIDREAIAAEKMAGLRVPADGWISPVVTGRVPNGCGEWCDYDPDRARALLAEMGGYDDPVLTFWYNSDVDHRGWSRAACQQIRANLGINCVSKPVLGLSQLRDVAQNGAMPGMYTSTWISYFTSADNFLTPRYASWGADNVTSYHNARLDALLLEAKATTDPAARMRMYHEAERVLAEDMPAIPVFFHESLAAWSPRVTDVQMTFSGAIDVTKLRRADR